MRIKEFIKKLEKLKYNDETEIVFGFLHDGEFYDCDVVNIDDLERKNGEDEICVTLDMARESIRYLVANEFEKIRECIEDLGEIINKYLI